MQTIMIDGSMYTTPKDLHLALKKLLCLPDYYGLNADALNDCLGERTAPVNLWILNHGTADVASALSAVVAVIRDNGGSIKELSRL